MNFSSKQWEMPVVGDVYVHETWACLVVGCSGKKGTLSFFDVLILDDTTEPWLGGRVEHLSGATVTDYGNAVRFREYPGDGAVRFSASSR